MWLNFYELLFTVVTFSLWHDGQGKEIREVDQSAASLDMEKVVKEMQSDFSELSRRMEDKMAAQAEIVQELQETTSRLNKVNTAISNDVARLTKENAQIARENHEILKANMMYREEIKSLRCQLSDFVTEIDARVVSENGSFTSMGCLSQMMTLSCPDERTINVTLATYAQYTSSYSFECPNSCCPPHPTADCEELVYDNSPQDWLALKYLCDGTSSCEFENPGAVIDSCEPGYLSDYMQVFYNCLPEPAPYSVGFTAYASDDSTGVFRNYTAGQLVLFDGVVTNYGGHYSKDTSTFICPFDGVYLFTINVITYEASLLVDIMRNDDFLVRAWVDTFNTGMHYDHGSNFVITECAVADTVWVRSAYGGVVTLYGPPDKRSTFSGHLLSVF